MNEELLIGTAVVIVGELHPWKGHVGEIIIGLRKPSIGILPPMYTVRLRDGFDCMVSPGQLKLLPK